MYFAIYNIMQKEQEERKRDLNITYGEINNFLSYRKKNIFNPEVTFSKDFSKDSSEL